MDQSFLARWLSPGITRKFVLINFLLFFAASGLTVVSLFAISLVSGLRAYVAGEGFYSKYQKDAVFYLRRYVQDGNEADYAKFSDNIKVPIGDSEARHELDKHQPDRARAAEFFRQGQNSEDDIPVLIKLFLRFRHYGFIENAISIWDRADVMVQQISDLGVKSHRLASAAPLRQRDKASLISQIDSLNERLITLENEFSRTLGEGSLWISGAVFESLLLSDLVLLILGVLLSSWLGKSIVGEIDEVAQAVDSIAKGDFSTRCNAKRNDELGRLAEGFNQMSSSIEHAQKELRHARDNALQASRVKSEFLANMRHEIRTPLNVVLGYTDVLADHIATYENQDAKDHIDAIRRAGKRLYGTIQGILDFSKIEAQAFELRPQPVKLGALLGRHIEDIRILAERKGIRLRCIIDEPQAIVLFDEYCISGALTNLLQNAIKFTEEGSVTAKLYRITGDRILRISIEDTGIGIEPAYLNRIFEPFSQEQVGYTRPFEGNGLGLALTRSYLQLNGADISVISRKGHGSTFTISFSPQSELSSASNAPQQVAATNGHASRSGARRPCILVVEDDPDNQALMRTLLKSHYEVRVASSADEARRELAIEGPTVELILMDFSLRGEEDGPSLTRKLRMDQRYKATPVVALTAHASVEDRKVALAIGFDAFLVKPVDRDELYRTIDLLVH
jgi:signal transduction histidine kinase/CheY-like chemotaxis protein